MQNYLYCLVLLSNFICSSEQPFSPRENKPNCYVKNGILIIEHPGKNARIYYVLPNSFSAPGFQTVKIEHKINEESEIEEPENCVSSPKL
jgi:hypothetical protein